MKTRTYKTNTLITISPDSPIGGFPPGFDR